ncbi:MAG: hypothetical protein AAGU11_16080 [Syntrophobacteraceae bacterium]
MDRYEQLQKQIDQLRTEVEHLKKEVHAPSQPGRTNPHPLEAVLWQRGFPVIAHGDQSQLVFPPNISSNQLVGFYNLMRRYSFRLFMRDLIQTPRAEKLGALTRYCSLRTVHAYMNALAEMKIVSIDPGGYRLLKQVPSFGPTLEWYVCEVFRREFLAPALFNVKLENTRYGGDYDVISIIAGRLVYVEVKSSPPRGVELQAVNAFLSRVGDLEPHVAIFLVDTELRMKDKLVPLLEDGLGGERKAGSALKISRLIDETFHIGHSLYLTNSRKGVYSNLRTCLRDFLTRESRGSGTVNEMKRNRATSEGTKEAEQ